MSSASGAAPRPSPIDDFSQCHAGILRQLQALDTLPALLEPAAQARRIAAEALRFFREVVFAHHVEEERELFPAVLASAALGAERYRVQMLVNMLSAEHRSIEAAWLRLEPPLKAVAKGQQAAFDGADISTLVGVYEAHARFEEGVFLPLSPTILERDHNHLAAGGASLHLRHALPELLRRLGTRI